VKAGDAAEKAAAGKRSKYNKFARDYPEVGPFDFVPFAIETHGAINKDALEWLKSAAEVGAETLGYEPHVCFRYALKRISIVLRRSLAAAIIDQSYANKVKSSTLQFDNAFNRDMVEDNLRVGADDELYQDGVPEHLVSRVYLAGSRKGAKLGN